MTPPLSRAALIAQSGYTNPGFADRYERYRPQPPAALVGLLERRLAARKTAADLGLDTLREVATRVMGDRAWPWYIGYRVRVGVR